MEHTYVLWFAIYQTEVCAMTTHINQMKHSYKN